MAHAVTTLRLLAEQTALLITGSSMINNYNDILERVKYHIVSQINYLLKIEQLELRAIGENNASVDAVIANYSIPTANLTLHGKNNIITLPVRPISLPHGAGVWSVVMEDGNGKQGEFMYLPNSVRRNFLATYPIFDKTAKFSSSLSKTIWGWYSHHSGTELIINGDYISKANEIKLQLLVVDIATMSEDDILPIPADMVNVVIEYVKEQMMSGKPTKDLVVDQNPNI